MVEAGHRPYEGFIRTEGVYSLRVTSTINFSGLAQHPARGGFVLPCPYRHNEPLGILPGDPHKPIFYLTIIGNCTVNAQLVKSVLSHASQTPEKYMPEEPISPLGGLETQLVS